MIWDLNIRIFHLMLIITVIISIISGKFSYFYIHEISGITLFFLILFRIYWGFFGGYYSKFKNFNLNKNSLFNYFKNKEKKYFGHNPLGSLSIFSIFVLILLTSLSGMFSSDDIFYDGPFVKLAPQSVGIFTNIHDILHYFLYLLIILHLSAVSYYQFFLKEKIINQMIDGKSKDKNFIQKDYPSKKNSYALLFLIRTPPGTGTKFPFVKAFTALIK